MSKKRIVITGLGVVSCLGNDVHSFYEKLLAGLSGVTTITKFPIDDYPTRFAGEIKDFDPEDYLDKKQARRVDPFIAYATVAGKKALEMAGITKENLSMLNALNCGVLIGSGMGGLDQFTDNVKSLHEKGPRRVSPFFIPFTITNMASAFLAIELGFMGPNYSISTACASANHSIIAAANHIRAGDADLMVCGGSEAAVGPAGLAGFCACKALSQRNDAPEKASRPWDTGRDGFVLGEGAGVIVLESLEHALARGAPILAEYFGGGISCDAHHFTEPRPDGLGVAQSIRLALRQGGIDFKDINYINAHATSTPAGDMTEINAFKSIFGDQEIVINGTKSMIGHSLGAAAGIEAVVCVKAITDQQVHPTINIENREPNIPYHIPTKGERHVVKTALSVSLGFGGQNATIALGPFIRNR